MVTITINTDKLDFKIFKLILVFETKSTNSWFTKSQNKLFLTNKLTSDHKERSSGLILHVYYEAKKLCRFLLSQVIAKNSN